MLTVAKKDDDGLLGQEMPLRQMAGFEFKISQKSKKDDRCKGEAETLLPSKKYTVYKCNNFRINKF
jgi:hypothetical protein